MANEPNPKSIVASAAGDNVLLAADDAGRTYIIHALAVIAIDDTEVEFYLHNEDHDLLGDANNKITVDKTGALGPAGFVLPYNHAGWMAADAPNEAIKLNLSAAVPVIVLVSYTLR